jgi:hypothetical protein
MKEIPASAFWLGWAGVLPFAALSALTIAGGAETGWALGSLAAYGMIILSFMGGVQWGLEMARPDGREAGFAGFAASVVPALVAFGASLADPLLSLGVLAVGFAGLLAYDLARVRFGIGPPWYARLRWQLSAAVLFCLAVVGLFKAV